MLKSFREDFRKFSRFSIFFRENAEEFLCVSVTEDKPSYIPSGSLEGGNVRASQGASSALKLCISYFLITSSVHAHQCCITQLLYLHFLDLQRLIWGQVNIRVIDETAVQDQWERTTSGWKEKLNLWFAFTPRTHFYFHFWFFGFLDLDQKWLVQCKFDLKIHCIAGLQFFWLWSI